MCIKFVYINLQEWSKLKIHGSILFRIKENGYNVLTAIKQKQ